MKTAAARLILKLLSYCEVSWMTLGRRYGPRNKHCRAGACSQQVC
jgi:hypothetical protein